MDSINFVYLTAAVLSFYHAVRDFLQAQGDKALWVNFWHWTLPYVDPALANAGSFVFFSLSAMIFLSLFYRRLKARKIKT
ncbi:MAG: hypothetical protein A3A80_02085 [Candidatus Terrybacteria bacterium RIFCSPLOWO2_01_FULL_44_24]|uniref:Uncharacterized protein n=1 Tax=Candidatus Terrybacteria bacterium RIFCSPHIGHO2_01_FULL_43_35 TaxID=1802361 RepID=A0A1G2PGB4_9BACT|nr:MAG: hypothetical protein A2828_01875 [Candidatus Terrybacteria bacterium RIFCSPHIGHO2_01_FULL_43_35]OHA50870.1 MAG: hypothetical protein A3A80_02085 [Candidatus Terrybacteria bacterium RIFCSPLOWO2_01_FULL_44_24]